MEHTNKIVLFFVLRNWTIQDLLKSRDVEKTLKACVSLKSGTAPTPINSKMNHVANQLIFKSVSVWKFFVLVLKFKDFVKITFKWGFAHFWRPYSYKQNLGPDYKTIFTSINKVTNSSISISFTAIIYSWKANRREHHSLSLKHRLILYDF